MLTPERRATNASIASRIGWRDKCLTLKQRMELRIERSDGYGCWRWVGTIHKHGYGNISINSKIELAHRMMWLLVNGEIPHGLHVLHRCDNRWCVNPDHLFLGTNADNVVDAVAKGRRRGPLPWQTNTARLSIIDVADIRKQGQSK